MLGLALIALLFAAAVWRASFGAFASAGYLGIDGSNFADYGRLWLSTGTPYRHFQLAGPYSPFAGHIGMHEQPDLYPPPFALVGIVLDLLPWPVWWLAPLGLLAWCVASWRPTPWAWPLIALSLAWPATPGVVNAGGATMWVAALTAAGLRWGWPSALILLKPSFLPLALLGAWNRSWWVACAAVGLVSLAMLPLWVDYLTVIRNAQGVSLLYSANDLPFVLLPVIAWIARRRVRAPSAIPDSPPLAGRLGWRVVRAERDRVGRRATGARTVMESATYAALSRESGGSVDAY